MNMRACNDGPVCTLTDRVLFQSILNMTEIFLRFLGVWVGRSGGISEVWGEIVLLERGTHFQCVYYLVPYTDVGGLSVFNVTAVTLAVLREGEGRGWGWGEGDGRTVEQTEVQTDRQTDRQNKRDSMTDGQKQTYTDIDRERQTERDKFVYLTTAPLPEPISVAFIRKELTSYHMFRYHYIFKWLPHLSVANALKRRPGIVGE